MLANGRCLQTGRAGVLREGNTGGKDPLRSSDEVIGKKIFYRRSRKGRMNWQKKGKKTPPVRGKQLRRGGLGEGRTLGVPGNQKNRGGKEKGLPVEMISMSGGQLECCGHGSITPGCKGKKTRKKKKAHGKSPRNSGGPSACRGASLGIMVHRKNLSTQWNNTLNGEEPQGSRREKKLKISNIRGKLQ